ncbi:MAG TPA: beta-xylosidase [Verrucomicrobiota bacterium]|nr:beta-xylosidase [Verrucomicrobiota bacterium]
MSQTHFVGFLTASALAVAFTAQATNSFPVAIRVDAAKTMGPLRPIWRFFGGDEPNYATMKDGQKLLAEYGRLRPRDVYFRTHNLLTSGDGTPALKWGSTDAYTEDAQGNPNYNWKILDRMFDSYLERGVRPYVQIGFMPQALSTKPEPYRHEWRPGLPYERIYTGWAYPPKDYAKWGELVYQWVKHCVERYGREEVETWYWETWNEANIGYWRGTPQEFHKLHDYAIDAVRRALPTARVGGPDSAGSGGQWSRNFYEHCLRGTNYATGKIGTPLDFVAFHAKGSPSYTNNHVRMGIANHLRVIDDGFGLVASFPELKNTPIVIGESDPEGCAACQGPSFSYRNGTVYSSYTAASFARKHDLADKHGVNFEGALTWAFTFEDQPYFAGFRQLASCGLPLPVFNVIRMFSQMNGNRVSADSSAAVPLDEIMRIGVRQNADVGAIASLDTNSLRVLVWHYHDDDIRGPEAAVELAVAGLPANASESKLTHYRVDEFHSNAYDAWRRMGSPIAPNARQYQLLQEASNLATLTNAPATIRVEDGKATLKFTLPRQGVSLLVLDWNK